MINAPPEKFVSRIAHSTFLCIFSFHTECQISNYRQQWRSERDDQGNPKINLYIAKRMICTSFCITFASFYHVYEPGEYSTFFLGRLNDYAYRLSQTQDNMRKEIRYGKHVQIYISNPFCLSSCLKSILSVKYSSEVKYSLLKIYEK